MKAHWESPMADNTRRIAQLLPEIVEIPKEIFKINGYELKIHNANEFSFGCANFSVAQFEHILAFNADKNAGNTMANRTISEVKLSSGVTFTIEQIEQTLEKVYEWRKKNS